MGADGLLSRRTMLYGTGAVAFGVLVPLGSPGHADELGNRYLTAAELTTLRALVDRIVPGQPEDRDHGAAYLRCAEAIDALLGAFQSDPPLIFAGAPFSDRGGHPVNQFAEFQPLDTYEEKAWRLRIEGSQGKPELEFNGPVRGYQAIYRDGLHALDRAAGLTGFAALPGPARDVLLRGTSDPPITALLDIAVPHTFEFTYGAPEYGGNKDLIAWRYTRYDGDVQPRGYTREQVENPDQPGLPELLPDLPVGIPLEDVLALLPLASQEAVHGLQAKAAGTLSGLRRQVDTVRRAAKEGFDNGS